MFQSIRYWGVILDRCSAFVAECLVRTRKIGCLVCVYHGSDMASRTDSAGCFLRRRSAELLSLTGEGRVLFQTQRGIMRYLRAKRRKSRNSGATARIVFLGTALPISISKRTGQLVDSGWVGVVDKEKSEFLRLPRRERRSENRSHRAASARRGSPPGAGGATVEVSHLRESIQKTPSVNRPKPHAEENPGGRI